jgi:hypothetical protein
VTRGAREHAAENGVLQGEFRKIFANIDQEVAQQESVW